MDNVNKKMKVFSSHIPCRSIGPQPMKVFDSIVIKHGRSGLVVTSANNLSFLAIPKSSHPVRLSFAVLAECNAVES